MVTAMKAKTQTAAAVRVVGQGTLAGSGLPFLLVSSQSEPLRTHVVVYCYEGVELGSRAVCDCVAAARYGRSCKHLRAARSWLAGAASVSTTARRALGADEPQTIMNRTKPFSLMK